MHQAQDAFVTGLHASLLGGAVTAVVTALAVAVLLRRRRTADDRTPCLAPAGPVPHGGLGRTDAA
ncbi:hypothetical protein Shyhy01_24670 [Streptomyces hygroscopicus subsp. hygroscopicus]|nr:hypothetical protein [Streptomyces hygroscopicus]GLX49517.1 hypothetical protein Shyhy01_24670 [Streptomyces hygroscopicus subsp. hygroscopicus]